MLKWKMQKLKVPKPNAFNINIGIWKWVKFATLAKNNTENICQIVHMQMELCLVKNSKKKGKVKKKV